MKATKTTPTQDMKLPALALMLLALLAYLPALTGEFLWDDDEYVSQNQTLRTAPGLVRIWLEPGATPQYYPLVFTSFWLEYHLWGLAPLGYHLVNVLLHASNGILLWRILRHLGVGAAWLVALIFVLHPVQVESVAWITERKNVLSAFFYLAAALASLHVILPETFADTAKPGPQGKPATRLGPGNWYALALCLFTAALLSKTVTCSLPAALLLVVWWKRGRIAWRDVLMLLPFFALGGVLAALTVWLEAEHVGAKGEEWSLTLVERCLIAGRALWFYAAKLGWPTNLSFIYPRWQIDASAWWAYLFPVAAVAVLVGLWLGRHRLGRGPLVACLFFAGTLLPALGFVNIYPMRFSFVADHFQYLATPGLLVLLVVAAQQALQRFLLERPGVAPLTATASVLVLGLLTFFRTAVYIDQPTLWISTLAENPDCWMAHNNLGEALFARGRIAEAQRHYEEAIRLKPEEAAHHYNLGKLKWFEGQSDEAIRLYQEAVRLDPDFAPAHVKLGLALRRQGMIDEAIRHFHEALRVRPRFGDAHNNLGVALAMQGKHAEAITHFETAVDIDPTMSGACFNLALAYGQTDRPREALEFARRATELAPDEPRYRQLLETLSKDAQRKR